MAWDLPTNFTNLANETTTIDGIGSLFQYASYVTNNAFGLGLIVMIFIMSFGVSALVNMGRAFASASFITLIFSVYFARAGLLTPVAPFLLLVMTMLPLLQRKHLQQEKQ